MPNLTANLVPTWPILAPLGPSWRQHKLQEASKWSSTGGLDRICGHLGAKRAPKSSTPQKWQSLSRKIVKTTNFNSKNEPHGTLKRIRRKRNIRSRTDPGFPTPGVRMTVVYTNSLKTLLCKDNHDSCGSNPEKPAQRSHQVGSLTKAMVNAPFKVQLDHEDSSI